MLISMYIISTAALFHNKINFKILNDACSFNDDSYEEKVNDDRVCTQSRSHLTR